jgi:galactokinase
MNIHILEKEFFALYGKGSVNVYFAPGRVNLIGEHIDYNGGEVFPCAISMGTYLLIRERADNTINLASLNFSYRGEYKLNDISKDGDEWVNYPLGVLKLLYGEGHKFRGADIMLYGDLPNGAGLSSSASVEVVTAFAIADLYGINITNRDIALLAQRAENEFVGVNCGIMDQFAVAMCRANSAIRLDCNTLEYTYVPVELNGCSIVIANTNKKRELADSKYNERRGECELALKAISKYIDAGHLCDITTDTFERYKQHIDNKLLRDRAEHVVYENNRVVEACKALVDNNIVEFGKLMNESHDSLRDLYEVTGEELDIMVEESRRCDGVVGSRMTGAGFGGCTVSVVKRESINSFIATVKDKYTCRTGLKPEFYVVEPDDGVKKIIT